MSQVFSYRFDWWEFVRLIPTLSSSRRPSCCSTVPIHCWQTKSLPSSKCPPVFSFGWVSRSNKNENQIHILVQWGFQNHLLVLWKSWFGWNNFCHDYQRLLWPSVQTISAIRMSRGTNMLPLLQICIFSVSRLQILSVITIFYLLVCCGKIFNSP